MKMRFELIDKITVEKIKTQNMEFELTHKAVIII